MDGPGERALDEGSLDCRRAGWGRREGCRISLVCRREATGGVGIDEEGSLLLKVVRGEVVRDRGDESTEECELSREEGGVRLGVEIEGLESTREG